MPQKTDTQNRALMRGGVFQGGVLLRTPPLAPAVPPPPKKKSPTLGAGGGGGTYFLCDFGGFSGVIFGSIFYGVFELLVQKNNQKRDKKIEGKKTDDMEKKIPQPFL
jgi:hypothetical protein